jgi:hypothetical protein
MTAHASATRLIGPALPESSLCLSGVERSTLLLLGAQSQSLSGYDNVCQALDIDTVRVASHHELPFRLHHCRPLAVMIDLPVESREMATALRCIAAYNPSLTVLVIAAESAAALGTLDAAHALWNLGDILLLPPQVSPRSLLPALLRAERARGVGRLMPIS